MLFAARDSRDMDRVWLMHVVGLDMTGVCERSVYGMFVQWEVDIGCLCLMVLLFARTQTCDVTISCAFLILVQLLRISWKGPERECIGEIFFSFVSRVKAPFVINNENPIT